MTQYYDLDTNTVRGRNALIRKMPNTSFPTQLSPASLETLNCIPFVRDGNPELTEYETYTVDDIVIEDNVARQRYTVVPKPAEEIKRMELDKVMDKFYSDVQIIKDQYPVEERETWATQIEEAKAYSSDPSAETPMIDAIISITLEDKAELVGSILAKAKAFSVIMGQALGHKKININKL